MSIEKTTSMFLHPNNIKKRIQSSKWFAQYHLPKSREFFIEYQKYWRQSQLTIVYHNNNLLWWSTESYSNSILSRESKVAHMASIQEQTKRLSQIIPSLHRQSDSDLANQFTNGKNITLKSYSFYC